MPFMNFFITMLVNIWGAAMVLQFYVVIRRPTRNDLEVFKSKLPKLLQFIYFNSQKAFIYSRSAERPAIDYLLLERPSVGEAKIGLLFYLILVYGIVFLFIICGDDINFNITYIVAILMPIRIMFFGFKLKRDPTFYYPE